MDPITREEMYLAAAAGYNVEPPEPITRKEVFLAKLAGMDVETPVPFTRRERFIEEAAMAENNAVIEPIEITENGTYTAHAGVDGYNPVTVDVPAPKIKLQDKTITENGEYTADSSFDGLGKVTVNVAGSGGGNVAMDVGMFTGNGGAVTVNHNLGCVPLAAWFWSTSTVTGNKEINVAAGISREAATITGKTKYLVRCRWVNASGGTAQYSGTFSDYGIDEQDSNQNYLLIYNATENSITFGSGTQKKTKNGQEYEYFLIGYKKE